MEGPVENLEITEIEVKTDIIEEGHVLGDWFVFRNQRHFGPLSSKQVRSFLTARMLSTEHFVWRPGIVGWVRIERLEAFKSYGKSEIPDISDDEFSERAQLTVLDRIALERKDLEFDEAPDVFENGNERTVSWVPESYFESFPHLIKSTILTVDGFSKGYRGTFFGIFLAILVGGTTYLAVNYKSNPVLRSLPSGVKNRLIEVSKQKESVEQVSLVAFEKSLNLRDPRLVVATNLPVGSRIAIEVRGVPETLVGAFRYSFISELNIQSKIFETEPLRQRSGKFIPAGRYLVAGFCLSCAEEKKPVFRSKFDFGIQDQASYQRNLGEFHAQVRQSAGLELNELKELSNTLRDQYQKSVASYVKLSLRPDKRDWNGVSAEWLATQRKLIDLFDQMESEDFLSELYYVSLYQAYHMVTERLFELHMRQDKVLRGSLEPEETNEISKLSQNIDLSLISLQSQLDLMQAQFGEGNGVPSKQGLKIEDIL